MASALYRNARSSGVTVRLLIAAVAIDHDVVLLHADRDFDGLAARQDSLSTPDRATGKQTEGSSRHTITRRGAGRLPDQEHSDG